MISKLSSAALPPLLVLVRGYLHRLLRDIECLRQVLVDRTDLHDEFAIIMKQRMDNAQDARLASVQTDKRFTIKDFLRRMDQWTR